MARILIIEDDADLVHVLSFALFRAGYEVHYAFNGQEGYDKILSLHPDVVLLDLMLPILAGTDVLKRAAGNPLIRDIPLIVMTAYGDQANLLERMLRDQGARDYLRKPFAPADLLFLLKRVLAEHPREDQAAGQVVKGGLRLDSRFRTVWIDDKFVATLPATRAKVLQVLLESKGPVKRARLLRAVWGAEGSENLLVKTIQRLREDLGPEEGRRIQTRDDGYEALG